MHKMVLYSDLMECLNEVENEIKDIREKLEEEKNVVKNAEKLMDNTKLNNEDRVVLQLLKDWHKQRIKEIEKKLEGMYGAKDSIESDLMCYDY